MARRNSSFVTKSTALDLEIAEWVRSCYHDPLRFVRGAYPWGVAGTRLEHFAGPDVWQREFLTALGREVRANAFNGRDPVRPVRRAVSSGHGVGKSVTAAWLVDWLMSTRPHCQGTVTANTFTQLQTKTWAAISAWTKICLTGHWFVLNTDRMYHPAYPDTWFCALQSSKRENSEAFAGQHAVTSSSFYLFDEASAIADEIAQVAEGGLTDGEPFIFKFGNATRSAGDFHRCAFGRGRDTWHPVIVDARLSAFTNKAQIAEWAREWGEDSDFFRVRVLGLPPSASDLQFVGTALVHAAMTRPLMVLPDDPLVVGLDLARGGDDRVVFRFRRGNDARSIPPIVIPGEQARDSMKIVALAADVLRRTYHGHRVQALFVDATGGSIGGPIADRLRQLQFANVWDVQFGAESPDPRYANMRAYIWGRMRDWLQAGGCIEENPRLETDLTAPGYTHDKRDRVLLESKEQMKQRDVASPDDGDALACTFAFPVAPVSHAAAQAGEEDEGGSAWG